MSRLQIPIFSSLLVLASFGQAQTVKSVALTPASVVGGVNSVGTLTLTARAPAAGLVVTLASNSVAAKVPTSVKVAKGESSATFTVTTVPVVKNALADISAKANGSSAKAALTVKATSPSEVALSPTAVAGGKSATGTVTLDGKAPAGGVAVTLASNKTAAKVPTTVTVSAGATTAKFTVTTVAGVSNVTASISATANGLLARDTLLITAPTVKAFTLSAATLSPNESVTGTLTITAPAPTGGFPIVLASDSAALPAPTKLVIATGATTGSFAAKAGVVTAKTVVHLTSTANGSSLQASVTVDPPAGLAASAWPKLHGDLANSGKGVADGGTGVLAWTVNLGVGNLLSSPTLASDGTIYVGGYDKYLYFLKVGGSVKAKFLAGGPITSSAAVAADGTVYVGAQDGKLYAINPSGAKIWTFATGAGIYYSSPAIGPDGTIYVGSWDDSLYAINPDGTKKWSVKTGFWVDTCPAIAPDGTLYFGSDDEKVYAVSADGQVKWSFATAGEVTSSPSIGPDGTVYVGSSDDNLYALKPNGTKKWSFKTKGSIIGSASFATDGTIYFGSDDHSLYALLPSGAKKWSYLTKGAVESSPTIGRSGIVYFGSNDSTFYALTPAGALKWTFPTRGAVNASPAMGADGILYIVSSDFTVHAIK